MKNGKLLLLCCALMPVLCDAQQTTVVKKTSAKKTITADPNQRHIAPQLPGEIAKVNRVKAPVVIQYHNDKEGLSLAKELKGGLEKVHLKVRGMMPLEPQMDVAPPKGHNFSYLPTDSVFYITVHRKAN